MDKVDFQLREPMTEKQHEVMLMVQETFNAYPALSAYVKALEKEREWQPIETAPKDGTKVLVFPPTRSAQSCSIARFEADKYARKPRPYWLRLDAHQVCQSRGNHPTYWKPLPEPPKETP
jgi:hypothetical protein